MQRLWKSIGLVMVLGFVAGAARADVLIDTTPSWDGGSSVEPFGVPNTATYGETVTVPSSPNTVLESFTYYMNNGGNAQSFIGYVYQWNPGTFSAEGSALYTSAIMTTTALNGFQAVQFNTGGVNLIAGDQYVMFASVSDPRTYVGSTLSNWGFLGIGNQPYTGGTFVFQNNGSDESQWTSSSWSSFGGSNLAFKADFGMSGVVVPEPSSLAVAVPIIVLSLGYLRARRKRAVAG